MKYIRHVLSLGKARVSAAVQDRMENKFRQVVRARNSAEFGRRRAEFEDMAEQTRCTCSYIMGERRQRFATSGRARARASRPCGSRAATSCWRLGVTCGSSSFRLKRL
ncbi:hypothetical protein PybrP1_008328 [[Pythium] brassicae (nom. inval.)]|nr:hypothetical protein PybrP1_008328 [[Pythium] brassicae (nom. inval.)]